MIEKTINGIKYCLDEEALTAEVIQKKGYEGDIIIPDVVVFRKISYRVMSIGYAAFCNCSALTAITIPNSVTTIGYGAISYYTSLASLVIPDIVTSIVEGAFFGCESLTSITYQGTISQWKKIEFRDDWNEEIPTSVVHCTDGDVEI